MPHTPINLSEKLAKFDDRWAPKVIAEMNDYQLKLAKLEGEFVWHDHKDTDEVFLVLDGRLVLELRDGKVELGPAKECHVMLIEPRGVVNTGDAKGVPAAENDVWI